MFGQGSCVERGSVEPTVLYSALHAKLTQVSMTKKQLSPVRCETGSGGMHFRLPGKRERKSE